MSPNLKVDKQESRVINFVAGTVQKEMKINFLMKHLHLKTNRKLEDTVQEPCKKFEMIEEKAADVSETFEMKGFK